MVVIRIVALFLAFTGGVYAEGGLAKPILVDVPTRADQINAYYVSGLGEARLRELFPELSERELDLLMQRIQAFERLKLPLE